MKKEKKIRLKACPFCANPNLRIVRHNADGRQRFTDRFAVLCDWMDGGCGAEGGHYYSPEEAAERWNQRKRKWDG